MADHDDLTWKDGLDQAGRRAKARLVGLSHVREAQHGLLLATAINAFGEDPRATFYVEGLAPAVGIPRPDLILLHPDVGVLVVENKGITLAAIHGVENTCLHLVRDGRLTHEDPFLQAGRVMFRLRDLTATRADLSEVLFLHTAALPRISRTAFEERYGVRWPDETLFAEHCADPRLFREHVLGFSQFSQRKARRASRLSKRAHDAAMTVLSGEGFLFGSFAPEGQRVTTRRFADVDSLRDRKLIAERDGRFDIFFAPRSGPSPFVRAYDDRTNEINGVVEAVRRLVENHRVLPQDILILFNSHMGIADELGPKLERLARGRWRVRFVDKAHEPNKNLPLIEDGVMTASTIASAKGYDAAVVVLVGMDQLGTEPEDRAIFYVGATRSKLHLVVTGVRTPPPSLFSEIMTAAQQLAGEAVAGAAREHPTPVPGHSLAPAPAPPAAAPERRATKVCTHCGSARLHAQYGFNYYFVCIDCTKNTPMDPTCPTCGTKAKVRKAGNRFFRDCQKCRSSELYHENVPLGSLFE